MDEINNILANKKYLTRRLKEKIINIIEKDSMSIDDFPEKFRPRIAELLMTETERKSRKRKQPDNGFENTPYSKKYRPNDSDRMSQEEKGQWDEQEWKKAIKESIKYDIEKRKRQQQTGPQLLDILITPIQDGVMFIEQQPNDMIIRDEDEEDEDYQPTEQEQKEAEEEENKPTGFLELIGKSIIRRSRTQEKPKLDLQCIETEEEKKRIQEIYDKINNLNDIKTPLKIKVLASDLPLKTKATVVKKLERLEGQGYENGDSKKFYDWIESLLKIPFNKYCPMPISNQEPKEKIGEFLNGFYKDLDKAIYGHKKVKQVLTETIAKWITHPTTKGHALAIVGPPGVGKTSLIREGLAKGLNRPFCSLSLAGMHDEAYLTGFALTYEGSQEGRMAKMLKNSGVMNPIIFMDELDKIDTVRHGLSVMNKLIEITDFSQNHEFEDLYYQDVKLDLSQCIFVFSLNHLENVDPILRDRLEIIHVKGFDTKEKVKIAQDYLIPSALKQFGFNKSDIIFSESIIRYINMRLDDEKGVRKLKEAIIKICRKINMLRFTKDNTDFKKIYNIPITITQDIVDKILTRPDKPFLHMYT